MRETLSVNVGGRVIEMEQHGVMPGRRAFLKGVVAAGAATAAAVPDWLLAAESDIPAGK